MLDLETSEHEDNEASNSSETRSKTNVKKSEDSATREKQRRMQHDFFNSMSKSRQPGDVQK